MRVATRRTVFGGRGNDVTQLIPCGGCGRHVLSSEPDCPFCGASVSAERPVPGRPERRLGRAATFAFGAALAAAAASGCGESHGPDEDAGTEETDAGAEAEDAGTDAGTVAPPYGAPPQDAGFAPLYGGAPED